MIKILKRLYHCHLDKHTHLLTDPHGNQQSLSAEALGFLTTKFADEAAQKAKKTKGFAVSTLHDIVDRQNSKAIQIDVNTFFESKRVIDEDNPYSEEDEYKLRPWTNTEIQDIAKELLQLRKL